GAVARVAALHADSGDALPEVGTADALLARPLRVFSLPEALPRAYAVTSARVVRGDEEVLGALVSPSFDPTRGVVLSEAAELPATAGDAPPPRVRIDRIGADRMMLAVDAPAPAWVVMVDAWTPGWSARIDGLPSAVLRANLAFRAVAVPSGRHE